MQEIKDVIDKAFSQNEEKIKALFPETWIHPGNMDFQRVKSELELMGFDFPTKESFKVGS